ncbi:hypothetical protein GCM10029976_034590 [Kribbella albertanoniae]|uniref:Uncharacterized protein n=1 Tax=Kribbella albertanoniae TaxID=1266829 RepID=A0A4R4Q0Y4_9ACTN|nr:hypothetical protein [Kribbella albertanoniae]TDC28577.1 hypothetical protein E1261_18130 [Kribbella albertanoniae]
MIGLAIAVAWLGFVLHNVADLPGQTLLSAETLYPSLVYVALIGVLRWSAWPLFGWAVLNGVGGGLLSVLPLPFLPFDPVQTFHHYSFHVIYTATQIPLAVLAFRRARGPQAL